MISTRRRPPCAVKFRDVPLSALVLCRGARRRGLSRGHAALGRRDLAVAAGGPAPAAQVTAHSGQYSTVQYSTVQYSTVAAGGPAPAAQVIQGAAR